MYVILTYVVVMYNHVTDVNVVHLFGYMHFRLGE